MLSVVDASGQQARWRLRPVEYDYDDKYRPRLSHKVADGVFPLRRSEEEQNVMDGEVFRFVTEGAPSGDATQPERREAVIAFRGSTKAEARTEHAISSTVLDLENETKTPGLCTLEEFLKAQKG